MFSVLYVDDESNVLEVTKLYLEVTGEFSVDTKQSVKDGLDALKNKEYNAVISDFQMPGTDGIEFLKIVRSTFGNIPFILFTGKGREDVAIQALDNGVDFYIQKGDDAGSQLAELRNKIRMAVQHDNAAEARINFEQRTDLFNYLPDAAFSIDKRGVIIAWNKAIEELTGIPAVDMFGKDNYEYALPFYGERCPLLIDLVLKPDTRIENHYTNIVREQHGAVITAETRSARPLGVAKILSCKAVPIHDNKGNVIGAIESMSDITPGKTAEHAREESEIRFQRAELIAHLGHWQLDMASGTMIYSEGAGAIYGLKNLVQSAQAAQQILLPEYRESLDEALHALVTYGKPFNREYKIQRVNDWALRDIHSVAAYDAEHRVVFGVIQDITERKQIEMSLWAMNEPISPTHDEFKDVWQKIEEITSMVPGVVFQYSVNAAKVRNVSFVNEHAGKTLFGFDPRDTDFLQWFTGHVHPDDRTRFIESVEDSQKRAVSWHCEGRFVKPSGGVIWFAGEATPVSHGNELVYSGVFLDITERKIAEKILRDSEGKFRSIVENSPESILIIDLQGTILFSNNAAVETIECSDCSSVIGRNIIEFIAPESREEMAKTFLQLSGGDETSFASYAVISAQGKKIRVETIGKAIVYEGKTAALLSVRNVTDRKQESEDPLHLPFNAMDEGMALHEIIFDADNKAADYRVLAINDAFERQLDITRDAVVGKTSGEAYAMTEPPYLEIFARVAETGKPETFETWFTPLQKHFRISVYSPRKNQFVTVFYDITERKLAEDAVRQANIQLNLMTSITRHDILNKVSALVGYYGIIRLKFPNPALTYYISKLEDTTSAIQSLMMDTQTYQNIGIREPQWQDLEKVAKRLQIPETIKFSIDLQGAQVYADPMLEKVFFNLLDNSIRHGGQVTEIRVSSRQSNEGLALVWEDNGTGIPNEEKDRIFEKGYGVNTGLGLSLCREILAITGMSMRETGEPGSGARFEIAVPKGAYRLTQMTMGEKGISLFSAPTGKT
ncbi:PAS domain S-box protein [Methanoregula sp.]|jgi:PAS domain S-box-containing protein|uniref:response regulator n=1 Tax=Methanoregula sp. TaxID=2052170 RepID=UPI003C26B105